MRGEIVRIERKRGVEFRCGGCVVSFAGEREAKPIVGGRIIRAMLEQRAEVAVCVTEL